MNNKTIAKKMINQVKSVITDPQAKSLLAAYHVEASFTHFYETHSHIYLVGKDITAVMAKHFPYFTFKTRDNKKTRHGIGDGSMSDCLNKLRRVYRLEIKKPISEKFIAEVGAPTFTKSQSNSPVAYLIDEVVQQETAPIARSDVQNSFQDLFN